MSVRRDDEDPRPSAPVEPAPESWFGNRARELGAFAIIGVGLFAMLALATLDARSLDQGVIARGGLRNLGGTVGYYIADASTFLFGAAAWALFLFVVAYGVLLFLGRSIERLAVKLTGVVVFTAMVALLMAGPDGGASEASRLLPSSVFYGVGRGNSMATSLSG